LKTEKKIVARFTDLAISVLIFNSVLTKSIDRADDQDFETQRNVYKISEQKGGEPVSAAELSRKLDISPDKAYGLLRKAASAGMIYRANRPTRANLKLYLPVSFKAFLPAPENILQALKGLPKKVKFVHPLTSKWVVYRRRVNSASV
jgi:hypothetical protein